MPKPRASSSAGHAPGSTNPGLKCSAPLAPPGVRSQKNLGLGREQPTGRHSGVPKTYGVPFPNMVRKCSMSKTARLFLVVPRQGSQLQRVNEKIASLAAVEPYGDLYGAFVLAAQLAAEAIEAAEELQQMPGIDRHAFDSTLKFWHRTQDCNRMAALNCAGGN